MLVCACYKIEYLSFLAVMLPNFLKKLVTLLYLVLGLINQIVKNSCSLASLACSRKFRSCFLGLVYTFLGTSRSCSHPPCFPS
jgi:hypothetical protein